jgi:DNA polymerase
VDNKHPFNLLAEEAALCRLCPGMVGQNAILSSGNGSLDSKILFLAEAPGRFGAGRTGIPFSGDRSGENFETLLQHIHLSRKDTFITNAVLCTPLKDGNNRRPIAQEIKNCSPFLEKILNLIAPELVVTLGRVGLESINRLLGTKYDLPKTAAKIYVTQKFKLLPLYHPSPRVTHWRRTLTLQKRDFNKIKPFIGK